MEEHTKKLLEECNSGCKMAVNSMDQVSDYIEDEKLSQVVAVYRDKHKKIEDKSSELLQRYGETGKEPGAAASVFSWFTTEIKLMLKDDRNQIAKLLMDGCNMGIQSISEDRNKYSGASKESMDLANELVGIEGDFMWELKYFL
ncbi:hypothetical protein C3B58_02705 [Lactonifactor longoviformis]|uniref:DUF2383 domain-containing protein n=1 Tax=Lactonifactor longoviformis DSM 17459 TaxID=1122155 RepID=A0A1M4UU44_9CLOT|nr:hypothetical protein [Lactonifactor longoviformis]POP34474.1 hypothetical protein C3B58_02705 [Lactonifactor longoviformis]SHE60232.1 hypothetical protein SAMN02745158_00984 [Lactonifactor longoviformis DSM 17459]